MSTAENTYTLRPWREGDRLALLEYWNDPENRQVAAFRSAFTPDSSAPFSRTIVAEHQGVPVAAGVVYETDLHPNRLWAYIEVAPEHRRSGLGTQLLQALKDAATAAPSGTTAFRTKVEPDSTGLAFAQARGFKVAQRSRMVRFEAGSVPAMPLRQDASERITQAIEDLATGSVELTQKFWDFYRAVHTWDEPADLPIGRVNRLFLSDEAEALGAVVLRDDILRAQANGRKGDMLAFAVSYRPLEVDAGHMPVSEDDATEVTIGYRVGHPGAREAILQLLSVLTASYPVQVEVDDSMEDLAVIVDQLIKMGAGQVTSETLTVVDG
ncbi:GNAT family N-acetyltransferase [Rothia nasimurium]|uniref:GNAT family N-acetyltransferase n=1 Tax=Rothia nasimurium TaxID=85336 RepID=UPI001F478C22|nr:GNAT family N-acetyltransferase [Rothia nasimurium]